jgi:hypothetical protein
VVAFLGVPPVGDLARKRGHSCSVSILVEWGDHPLAPPAWLSYILKDENMQITTEGVGCGL